MSETSIELNDLMFAALDHAVESIEDGGPLIPFVISMNSQGERHLTRFANELLEEGLEAAQAYIQKEKNNIKAYAIAWDGFITLEGKKWDCALVEAGEDIVKQGVLLAQRYEKQGLLKKKNKSVGNPALVDELISRVYNT